MNYAAYLAYLWLWISEHAASWTTLAVWILTVVSVYWTASTGLWLALAGSVLGFLGLTIVGLRSLGRSVDPTWRDIAGRDGGS